VTASRGYAPLVLVADDDDDILSLVTFRLERSGYRVIQAVDGAQALDLAREHKPDLAVLDVMMPRLTGLEVARALREDESTRELPVILLTARVQDCDVQAGLEAGATAYVRKPFSPRELWERVDALLACA
jgi:DNA-binding response OmpR family regulator